MSGYREAPGCEQAIEAAPYVLGALEPSESERFRDHLRTCAICTAEVTELQVAADVLPASVPMASGSQAVRERVLQTVRSEAELLRAAGDGSSQPRTLLERWRSRRVSILSAGVAVAASAAVAAVIAIGAGSSSTPVHVTKAQMMGGSAQGASASLRQVGSHAELAVSNLPQPSLGRIYEVWLSRGGPAPQPTDALFSVTSTGSGSVNIPGNLHGVKEVMVTSEPLGGSRVPTREPLIRVAI